MQITPDARKVAVDASAPADMEPIVASSITDGGEADPTAYDDELAALERELQDLYHPDDQGSREKNRGLPDRSRSR